MTEGTHEVRHDADGHRFVVQYPDGEGKLVYMMVGPEVMDLYHAEVDSNLRHRGIASALAEGAFNHARRMGYKVIPSCPFVRAWLRDHPDERELVSGQPPEAVV